MYTMDIIEGMLAGKRLTEQSGEQPRFLYLTPETADELWAAVVALAEEANVAASGGECKFSGMTVIVRERIPGDMKAAILEYPMRADA